MLISHDWNVHGTTRYDFMASRPKLITPDQVIMESPRHFSGECSTRSQFRALLGFLPFFNPGTPIQILVQPA